jgi:hypothetical protein
MSSQMYSYWPGTSSMELTPSSEGDMSSTSKIHLNWWYLSVHYHIHKCQPPVSILNQIHPVHASPIPPRGDPFCCYPPIYGKIYYVVSFPYVSQPKDCTHHHHQQWHNSPLWAKVFLRSFCHPSLFLAALLQCLSPNFLASPVTPSSHLNLGLPFCLLPSTTAAKTLLAGFWSSSRMICPAHLTRLILMYVIMSLSLYSVYN